MPHVTDVAETNSATCPEWCISNHAVEHLHLQVNREVSTMTGSTIDVSVFHDEDKGIAGVHLHDFELTWEQAAELGALLTNASYAAALASLGN